MAIKTVLFLCLSSVAAVANAQEGWTVPDDSSAWGSTGKAVNAPYRANKNSTNASEKALGNAIPDTPVANPFDASGVYMGETQTLGGTGVDPASGMTVPDAPVIAPEIKQ